MKRIITLLFLFLFSLYGWSQGRIISGTVTDAEGNGIPGVTVLLVGTTTGAITDLDGKYQISATSGTLRFSYIGFTTQEVPIGAQNVINITLVEELTELNEVVVIGYGVQRKKDVSTAVVVVDDEAIRDRPIVNAAQALQGKAAGVQVMQNSGEPGASMSVRVRGATSVLASNEPAYVVDGIIVSDISAISPNDILSMTVLKDATSQAIYGARGANGVVIITTKRGEANIPTISFNTYGGASWLRKPIDVLSTRQYRDLMIELGQDWDTEWTHYSNWSDSVFETGWQQSYQLSFSGGDAANRYYVSGSYFNEAGIVRPAKFDRYSIRLNLDNQLRSWLKLSTNITISQVNTKDTPDNLSSGRGGVIMSALNTPPFLDTYSDEIGQEGWYDVNPFQPSWENPIAYMEGPDQSSIDRRILGSIDAEAKIVKGLYYRPRIGIDLTNHMWDYFLDPKRTGYGRQLNGLGQSDKSTTFYWVLDNILEYSTSIGKNNFSIMAGTVAEKSRYDQTYLSATDFPPDYNVQTLNAGNIVGNDAATRISEYTGAAFIGRLTYNYANRYYFLANFRRDGTSVLTHKWDNFPSVSVAWRISDEPFLREVNFIDDLKLRAGWGKLGNREGISPDAPYGTISFVRRPPTSPPSGPAINQTSYGNPDLRWESTEQANLGLDLTTLGGRLTLSLDVYQKTTKRVILPVQLSQTLPITELRTNAGEIKNKGLEFDINSINTNGDFKWSTNLNMSFNNNEVTDVGAYTPIYFFGNVYSINQNAVIIKEGEGLGAFYGYISEGVDPETGDIIYKDVDGNGIITASDRTIIGNGMPTFTFGLTNTFSFKRFDFNFFIQGNYGNDIFNATKIDLEGMFDTKNQSTAVLDRWTPDNPNTDIPRAGNMDNVRVSSRFIEDGSYVRLKSITLSYRIFENKSTIKLLSVYVTGNNLFTLTNYTGFDPEVSQYGNTGTSPGFDYGTYPQARSIIVGLNLNL